MPQEWPCGGDDKRCDKEKAEQVGADALAVVQEAPKAKAPLE
jgi:hypothetical protein